MDESLAADPRASDRRPPSSAVDGVAVGPIDARELDLLAAQLERMRGMLFGYSELFFRRILVWTVIVLALLVLGSTSLVPAAVVPVPFLVPFAFLETGYLFFYTVFARRHAEQLERRINDRLGRPVLTAHRLEAAYLYPPDAPKIAAFSLGRTLGYPSAMTAGYAIGGGLLWLAGLVGLAGFVDRLDPPGLMALAVPGAISWTAAIAAYLLWTFLARRDEDRLLTALELGRTPEAR